MKKLMCNIRNSTIIKNILYWLVFSFVALYCFCVPSFGATKTYVHYIPYVCIVLLSLSALLYCFFYDDFKINKSVLLVPLFSLFALAGTAAFSRNFKAWSSLILLSASFIALSFSFKIIRKKTLVITAIVAGLMLFSFYYLFHYNVEIFKPSNYSIKSPGLGWFFDNPNGIAAYSTIGFSLSCYNLLFLKNKIRFSFLLPTVTLLVVGISTLSRTFIVSTLFFSFVYLFFIFKKRKWAYWLIVCGLIGMIILFINLPITLSASIKDSFKKAFETLQGTSDKPDTSIIERVVWADYGLYLGSKNLIIGYGANGFSLISGVGTYSHSNFSEVLCDFGLIGLLLFYSPLILFFVKAFFDKKADKRIIVPFSIYYLLVGITNVFYYNKIYYLIVALLFFFTFINEKSLVDVPLVKKVNKIVIVCDTMKAGGAERVIASISNEMSNKGIEVSIIGVGEINSKNSFYELNVNVNYYSLQSKKNRKIRPLLRVIKLRKKLLDENPDVVISFLPNANIYTWISLFGLKIPHIVSERNNPYINPKDKLTRFLKMQSFIKAEGAVFQTSDALNFYPKSVQKKSSIIYNPIVLSSFRKQTMPYRNKTVLAVGRLTEQKNYTCLIDAFKLFNEKKNNSYFLKIYGDGNLRDDLKNYCKITGIEKNVIFAGNDNKWHEKELDDAMYVLSSNYEGLPNALAEAMALGIPSISTDCPTGGPKELINDGVNGYLVPVNDCFSLSKKMLELSEHPNIFYNSTKSLIDDFSSKRIAEQWIKYIKSLNRRIYE